MAGVAAIPGMSRIREYGSLRRRPRSTVPSNLHATLLVARKELVSSFRDRQTTLYAIVVPLVLYPFLFWTMLQGALLLQGSRERTEVELALFAEERADVPEGLRAALTADPGRERLERVEVGPLTRGRDESAARARVRHGPEPDPAGADAVLLLRGGGAADSPGEGTGTSLFFDSTESRSELARGRVERRLPEFAARLRETAAARMQRDPADLMPLQVEEPVDVAAQRDRGAYLLSFLLPMLLVVMTVMGAFYPAVDSTAGERERRTEETTLLLPVPRAAVHQGKILAVCTTAVLATGLNLLALGLSAGHLVSMARLGRDLEIELPIGAFLAITPLAILFALFVSAVLTGVAAFTRTFQEGQALLGPVQMVFILPALAGVIPGVELTPALACVPVLNVVFAFRALLQGRALPLEYTITAVSLCVYASIAVWLAMRVLGSEAGSRSRSRGRLFARAHGVDGGSA
jgi:ABC-type Na+ efflux pump permease subunit